MAPERSGAHVVRFGDCALDLRSGELTRDGQRCLLPEQPLRVLTLLPGSREPLSCARDLRRELWNDGTFVDFETPDWGETRGHDGGDAVR